MEVSQRGPSVAQDPKATVSPSPHLRSPSLGAQILLLGVHNKKVMRLLWAHTVFHSPCSQKWMDYFCRDISKCVLKLILSIKKSSAQNGWSRAKLEAAETASSSGKCQPTSHIITCCYQFSNRVFLVYLECVRRYDAVEWGNMAADVAATSIVLVRQGPPKERGTHVVAFTCDHPPPAPGPVGSLQRLAGDSPGPAFSTMDFVRKSASSYIF